MRPSYFPTQDPKKNFCIVVIFILLSGIIIINLVIMYVVTSSFCTKWSCKDPSTGKKLKRDRKKKEGAESDDMGSSRGGCKLVSVGSGKGDRYWSVWIWVKWPFPGEWLGNWGFVVNLIKLSFEFLSSLFSAFGDVLVGWKYWKVILMMIMMRDVLVMVKIKN